MGKRTTCDKCLSKIVNKKCDCGVWYDNRNEAPFVAQIMEEALLAFGATGQRMMSGDNDRGSCFVFFKGNHNTCRLVKDFISQLDRISSERGNEWLKEAECELAKKDAPE